MEPDVCAAIQANRVLEFEYGGVERQVEPLSHGVNRFDGELLYGYQRTGSDGAEDVDEGWRMFEVSKIGDLRVTDRPFARYPDVAASSFLRSFDRECCRL
ncbi:WYL domain-containing protein [Haloarchaeobius sp. DT45]|uniref:WYL domain-containing protein n=1 Tax=Haloarchaeobius sp. DT45 TaxID=3446116 RepID=UPI003F6C9AB6